MTGIDLLGFAAGTLTTCAFWPQLQKTWSTKSAGDVSLGMLAIFSSGVCLWFLYGLVLHAWPIILTNLVTLLLTGRLDGIAVLAQVRVLDPLVQKGERLLARGEGADRHEVLLADRGCRWNAGAAPAPASRLAAGGRATPS